MVIQMITEVYGVRADVNEHNEILLLNPNDMATLLRGAALAHPDVPEILVQSCDYQWERGTRYYRPGAEPGRFQLIMFNHADSLV